MARIDLRPDRRSRRRAVQAIAGLLASLATGSTVAATPPAPALGVWTCVAAPGEVVTVVPGCSYGLPEIVGDRLAIPKACRFDVGGRLVDRHTVEIRHAYTGKRIGQAALPHRVATPESEPLGVGKLLPGVPLLLAHAGGLAAVDVFAQVAEPAFETGGRLVGVARSGDRLVLVELASAATATAARLDVALLDLEAGLLVAEGALRAPGVVADVALEGNGRAVRIGLAHAGERLVATLTAQPGKGDTAGTFDFRLTKSAPSVAAPTLPGGCAVATSQGGPLAPAAVDGSGTLGVGPALVGSNMAGGSSPATAWANWRGPEECGVIVGPLTGPSVWAWMRTVPGKPYVLRRLACSPPDP
ncbi:MAG: hypothetical protein EXR79_05745 [Myxococcales bacterium]|nr:hypothetical protein [Myxococcales bacterium]